MPDERRCPRCGSEPTSAILPVSKDLPHWCSKPGCELPCWLWDDWETLQRELDEAKAELDEAKYKLNHGEMLARKINIEVLKVLGRVSPTDPAQHYIPPVTLAKRLVKAQSEVNQSQRERDEAKAEVELLEQTVQTVRDRCSGNSSMDTFARGICDEILAAEAEGK